MSRAGVLVLGVIAVSAPASAQAPHSPGAPAKLDLSTGTAAEECEAGEAGEVVVCGERGRSPYRIDADVYRGIRARELAENPPRLPSRVPAGDPCKTGPNGCPGEGALPLMAIALTAAKMAVKAIEGEDWTEPLRTGTDEYQLYRDSKAAREPEPE